MTAMATMSASQPIQYAHSLHPQHLNYFDTTQQQQQQNSQHSSTPQYQYSHNPIQHHHPQPHQQQQQGQSGSFSSYDRSAPTSLGAPSVTSASAPHYSFSQPGQHPPTVLASGPGAQMVMAQTNSGQFPPSVMTHPSYQLQTTGQYAQPPAAGASASAASTSASSSTAATAAPSTMTEGFPRTQLMPSRSVPNLGQYQRDYPGVQLGASQHAPNSLIGLVCSVPNQPGQDAATASMWGMGSVNSLDLAARNRGLVRRGPPIRGIGAQSTPGLGSALHAPPYYDPFQIKHRRRTTPEQLIILEAQFEKNSKPDIALRKQLADQLDMTPREVQVWMQNRRAKAKKLEREKDNPKPAKKKPGSSGGESPDESKFGEGNGSSSSPQGNGQDLKGEPVTPTNAMSPEQQGKPLPNDMAIQHGFDPNTRRDSCPAVVNGLPGDNTPSYLNPGHTSIPNSSSSPFGSNATAPQPPVFPPEDNSLHHGIKQEQGLFDFNLSANPNNYNAQAAPDMSRRFSLPADAMLGQAQQQHSPAHSSDLSSSTASGNPSPYSHMASLQTPPGSNNLANYTFPDMSGDSSPNSVGTASAQLDPNNGDFQNLMRQASDGTLTPLTGQFSFGTNTASSRSSFDGGSIAGPYGADAYPLGFNPDARRSSCPADLVRNLEHFGINGAGLPAVNPWVGLNSIPEANKSAQSFADHQQAHASFGFVNPSDTFQQVGAPPLPTASFMAQHHDHFGRRSSTSALPTISESETDTSVMGRPHTGSRLSGLHKPPHDNLQGNPYGPGAV